MNALRRCTTALALVAVLLGCQPEDETPGLWLSGEVATEHVDDWGFTDHIDEIFVETRPWYGIPHSTTIWCVQLGAALYIGSYGDQQKTWEENVLADPGARLSIGGKLYEVSVLPLTEPGRLEAVDAAYTQKYDMAEVFGDEIPEWRYYEVRQDARRPDRL